MNKFKKRLCFILTVIFFITIIDVKFAQPVYASGGISATPSWIETKEDQKIYVDTGGQLCYVRYTSNQNRPSVDQMWRIPQGNNYQDFNVPGEWYLHVYVPATGEWGCFGPYKRDAMPPDVPRYKNPAEGKWVRNENVSYDIYCLGDLEDHGYDAINDLWTSWPSGFWQMEKWNSATNGGDSIGEYKAYTTDTKTEEGWYVEWYRSVDKIYNYSEWSKTEFGIDRTPPTITPNAANSGNIFISAGNMQDKKGDIQVSGNKQITFTVWKEGGSKVTKVVSNTTEGADIYQDFSYSELGGASNDKYNIEIMTEDNAGNTMTYPLIIEGNDVTTGDPKPSEPDKPIKPDPGTDPDEPDDPGPETPNGNTGEIKFDPNETIWTNKGKEAESEGKYPVDVFYTGDDPYETNGVATIEKEKTDSEGNTTTVTSHKNIKVSFPFDHIDVSDAVDDTVEGTRGTVNIEQEGYQLHLHGEGVYGDAEYDEPDDCVGVEYDDPPTPVGDSKYYNLDWTKPVIKFSMDGKQIFSTQNGAIRKPSILGIDDSFYGDLKVSDNLSGVKFIEYKWTYGNKKPTSGYTQIYESANTNTDRSSEVIKKTIEKPVGDNLYLHVRAGDVAGDNGKVGDKNIQYECFGPFEDPIKLLDYQITDIRDPRWTNVFWNDNSYEDYKGFTYKANQLPVDQESHPTIQNAYPKKGYAFYFDITSEYLYRDKDRIEVTPSFYYVDSNNKRVPLDLYYNNQNDPLTKWGSDKDNIKFNLDTEKYGSVWIGGISKLTLTKGVRIVKGREWLGTGGWKDEIQYKDGKIQWWYGKYLIPATSIFVKQGDTPRPENIINANNIIVNFQIIAYKNGIETLSSDQIFTYVPDQWKAEGGPKNNYYKSGDVIVYDNKYSAISDYKSHVIQ